MLIKQSMEAGLQLYKSGDFRLAIREFSKVSSESSQYFTALYNRSLCHRALKSYRRAIGDLKNALEIEPNNHRALLALGINYFEIDGHDFKKLTKLLNKIKNQTKSSILLANTIKGKGVKFFENNIKYNHNLPDKKVLEKSLKLLERN